MFSIVAHELGQVVRRNLSPQRVFGERCGIMGVRGG